MKKIPESAPWIESLASYLTGWLVAHHSIGLSMRPETVAFKQARLFFDLRTAYGVNGYADQAEAERSIKNTVTASPLVSPAAAAK